MLVAKLYESQSSNSTDVYILTSFQELLNIIFFIFSMVFVFKDVGVIKTKEVFSFVLYLFEHLVS